MSADNSFARSGRDVEAPAEQAGFQMPPELARQYQVRIVEPSDGSARRVGMFLPRDRENPSIEIRGSGDHIVARNEDPETVTALVRIARHNGWEGIDVEGTSKFRNAVWTAATREGLTVRGYEPQFGEEERMEDLRRAGAARREREESAKPAPAIDQAHPATTAEPAAPVPTVEAGEATVAARSPDARNVAAADTAPANGSAELSDGDRRLLLMLSVHTQDRRALLATLREDMEPLQREVQHERINFNGGALGGALDRALESPTLAIAFARSGYEPTDLRQMASDGAWENDVADAVDLVREGLNRRDVTRDAGVEIDDKSAAGREDRRAEALVIAPGQQPASEPQLVHAERQRDAATGRRQESEELAELFLHGGAARIAQEPRLANALQAQTVMEQHIGEVFDGDVSQMSAANLESRQMISGVLRRGLDVSVREPTPVRQRDLSHPADLER